MKFLMKCITFILLVALIIILMTIFNLKISNDFLSFNAKLITTIVTNAIPIVTIALCCKFLESKENKFCKFTIWYMIISIIISTISILIYGNSSYVEGLGKIIYITNLILSSIHIFLLSLCLIITTNTNNSIAEFIKKAAIVVASFLSVSTIVITIFSLFGESFSLVNYLLTSNSPFSSISLIIQIYISLCICLIFFIILLYITNYAFSNCDYDIKDTFNKYDKNKINNNFNKLYANKTINQPNINNDNTDKQISVINTDSN